MVQGTLIRRQCPTKIKIYSPVDCEDRRAIVILEGAHNHPCFPSTKLSHDGKAKYKKAVNVLGVSTATVLKIDAGM